MRIGIDAQPLPKSPQQPRFGAWTPGLDSQPLRQLLTEIEDTLELPSTPPPTPEQREAAAREQYPAEQRPRIQELQETLRKVEPNNGYGIKNAIEVLRTMTETGYTLNPEETEKFKLLVRKDSYGLNSAISNFPSSSSFSRNADFTMADIEAVLSHWLQEQTYYQPIDELIKTMDRSTQFTATANIQTMIANRLRELKTELQNEGVRAALLKRLGSSFRPKIALAADIQTVMKALLNQSGPVSEERQASIDQAVNLIAQRNAKIIFAGRTPTGDLYIFTQKTNGNYENAFYVGKPGAMKSVTMTGGIRARNGSDSQYTLEGDLKFRFLRGGLGEGDDLTQWSATLNEIAIPFEFPTPTLEPKRY